MLRRLIASGVAVVALAGCGGSPPESGSAAPVDCALDKCVALTFDDGPTPYTDRLLDVLVGAVYGGRENGPPANLLHDIPADRIPPLPATPSPAPMPNFPIADIPGANSGGPNNGL